MSFKILDVGPQMRSFAISSDSLVDGALVEDYTWIDLYKFESPNDENPSFFRVRVDMR